MPTEKLTQLAPEDQYNDFGKILLMTGNINMQSHNVHQVLLNRYGTRQFIKDNPSDKRSLDFFNEMISNTQELLKETQEKLFEIYDSLAEFCNGCDAVSELDIQVSTPVFNAMRNVIVSEEEEED